MDETTHQPAQGKMEANNNTSRNLSDASLILSSPAMLESISDAELRNNLLALFGNDINLLAKWMREPNPAFKNKTPLQLIQDGESARLYNMVGQIRANVAS